MLFNSAAFLLFFPTVCIIYYAIPSLKLRNLFLLAASYWFYMNWEPAYALLLLSSTLITWTAALLTDKCRSRSRRKLALTAAVVANLAILFVFKYYGFAADIVTALLQKCRIAVSMPQFTLLLPVGISFYIFQALGYSIDVFRGTVPPQKNLFDYALFVSFFPQLVAGPIERATNLLPQFGEKHRFDYDNAMLGIRWMVWGYFLKLVVADRCGIYVDTIFNNLGHHNGGSMLAASALFPLQIYGDFAGYSLIAIGAARIMGFRLMQNFRRPYLSTGITEFWRRWHISLSTWFKDYLYIPLGGNRRGRLRTYFNLLATFTVSGLWHGANLTFVLWGLWHGAAVCLERAAGLAKPASKKTAPIRWCATMCIVWAGWILFRANTAADALTIYRKIFTQPGMPFTADANMRMILFVVSILMFKELKDEFGWRIRIADSQWWIVRHLYIVAMILCILLLGVLNSSQFIYFQF